MRTRRRLALAITGLALVFPGAALAQSAGDDQYSDPFGGGNGSNSSSATPTPTPAAPAPATSAPSTTTAPSTTAATAAATPVPTAAPATAVATSANQLPYTGANAGLLALAGAVLMGGGVALRVRLREPS